MIKSIVAWVFVALFAVVVVQDAYAGRVEQQQTGAWVFYGDIVSKDAEQFKKIPMNGTVVMVSRGGLAMEGFRIGKVLKERNITVKTFSIRGQRCESACAIAAIHAPKKHGKLYFHKAYFSNLVRAMHQLNGYTNEQLDAALKKSNTVVAKLMVSKGASKKTIKKFWETKPTTFVSMTF